MLFGLLASVLKSVVYRRTRTELGMKMKEVSFVPDSLLCVRGGVCIPPLCASMISLGLIFLECSVSSCPDLNHAALTECHEGPQSTLTFTPTCYV